MAGVPVGPSRPGPARPGLACLVPDTRRLRRPCGRAGVRTSRGNRWRRRRWAPVPVFGPYSLTPTSATWSRDLDFPRAGARCNAGPGTGPPVRHGCRADALAGRVQPWVRSIHAIPRGDSPALDNAPGTRRNPRRPRGLHGIRPETEQFMSRNAPRPAFPTTITATSPACGTWRTVDPMHLGTKREGSRKPYLLDLAGWKTGAYAGSWKWQETGARAIHKRRMHSNATILPTGKSWSPVASTTSRRPRSRTCRHPRHRPTARPYIIRRSTTPSLIAAEQGVDCTVRRRAPEPSGP